MYNLTYLVHFLQFSLFFFNLALKFTINFLVYFA